MLNRIKSLWKLSGIKPTDEQKKKIEDILMPKKERRLATIITLDEPLQDFPPEEDI